MAKTAGFGGGGGGRTGMGGVTDNPMTVMSMGGGEVNKPWMSKWYLWDGEEDYGMSNWSMASNAVMGQLMMVSSRNSIAKWNSSAFPGRAAALYIFETIFLLSAIGIIVLGVREIADYNNNDVQWLTYTETAIIVSVWSGMILVKLVVDWVLTRYARRTSDPDKRQWPLPIRPVGYSLWDLAAPIAGLALLGHLNNFRDSSVSLATYTNLYNGMLFFFVLPAYAAIYPTVGGFMSTIADRFS